MRRFLRSTILAASASCLLAACTTQTLSGLHVPEVQEGVYPVDPAAEAAEPSPGWPPYGSRQVPELPSAVPDPADAQLRKYAVIRVSPEVVATLRQNRLAPDDPAQDLPTVIPSDIPPEYRIGPGDILLVTVWGHPEFAQPVSGGDNNLTEKEGRVVASDGSLYYPQLGSMHVAGLTAREVRDLVTRQLAGLVVEPRVDVKVLGYRAWRVQVSGEVEKPGTITLDDMPKGILQALDESGGLTPEASRRRAVLVRKNARYPVDLATLLSGDDPSRNLQLFAGDALHFPSQARDRVYLLGQVRQQQPVTMQDATMPLVEALSVAGGLDELRAKASGVAVFRLTGSREGTVAAVYTLDLGSAEGMLLASQFPLSARDIVYVASTALARWNTVIEQILPTVNTVWLGDQIEGFD